MVDISDCGPHHQYRLVRMLKMRGRRYLVCLWILLFTLAGPARSEFVFLERNVGESVDFPCEVENKSDPPYGFYLKRGRRQPPEMLFKLTENDFSVNNLNDKNRTRMSGDPSHRSVNVTISELRADDTDRYFCEFVVDVPNSKDLTLKGKKEFFLLVHPDTVSSMDIGFVETCAGASAVLPCVPPRGGAVAVEGVILKRQKGQRAPVEVLYNSKHLHQRSPTLSQFPKERVQLSLVSSSGGMTYNLTLLQLQPEDSALYSCTLLLHGLPDSTGLGRQVVFVSVQDEVIGRKRDGETVGKLKIRTDHHQVSWWFRCMNCEPMSSNLEAYPCYKRDLVTLFHLDLSADLFTSEECGCSSYSSLLYALSAAVAILLFSLLIGCALFRQDRARSSVKSHPQASPIYEEMTGVHPERHKLAPNHLEEMDSSEYKNGNVKKPCPENYYERPSKSFRRATP